MRWDGVLVRFGEIGIKSAPVRRAMVERLRQNLLAQMERRAAEGDVLQHGSRLWMAGPDTAALLEVAVHTFGVVSASQARRVPSDMPSLEAAASEVALAAPVWRTFAVRASREGTHSFNSQEVGVRCGSAVWRAAEAAGRKPAVDLDHPELELGMEIREQWCYVSSGRLAGPGGLPMGSQGDVVCAISDEPSVVAAWLMMRRGCRIHLVHVGTQRPASAARLRAWGAPADVQLLQPAGPGARNALLACAEVVERRGAPALVTGETLLSPLAKLPCVVLRPVCGLAPSYMQKVAARLGPAVHAATSPGGSQHG